ncbi:16S rRNA (cytidine(1402)-2'-O)-methyltransferase [Candidatus Parcubacteria bacterium]|nr:MAG: 16S rRNA (cytidine(1402)-2'-O)-methyltransferase [Candidatus Parcubacteria bacterium]
MDKAENLQHKQARLYVVSTPIGNLDDVSKRALYILRSVDIVACEDTRVTKKIFAKFGISNETVALHQHSGNEKEQKLLKEILNGKSVALVTDAGTPAISDPGSVFVAKAARLGVNIVPIPGPSAVTAALSICGFPTNVFTFIGFPPNKKGRNKFFARIAEIDHTVVLYESKHRIIKTLSQLPGDRQLMVARELTKIYETIYRGMRDDIIKALENGSQKGEFTIVIAPKEYE